MAKMVVLIASVFSCLIHFDIFALSILPFDQEQEKQRYIFRTLTSIERQPVWFYGDGEDYGIDEEAVDESINLAFYERGLDPAEWYADWNDTPASATLKTQVTFYGKLIMIDVGLLSEALLLESQVFIPAIIWKKRTVMNFEGKELQVKEELAKQTKQLVGDFLDEYIHAITNPSKN